MSPSPYLVRKVVFYQEILEGGGEGKGGFKNAFLQLQLKQQSQFDCWCCSVFWFRTESFLSFYERSSSTFLHVQIVSLHKRGQVNLCKSVLRDGSKLWKKLFLHCDTFLLSFVLKYFSCCNFSLFYCLVSLETTLIFVNAWWWCSEAVHTSDAQKISPLRVKGVKETRWKIDSNFFRRNHLLIKVKVNDVNLENKKILIDLKIAMETKLCSGFFLWINFWISIALTSCSVT